MKYTGIELLQAIKDGKIEDYTKVKVFYNGIPTKHTLTVTKANLVWKPGEFYVGELWDDEYTFEIIEEKPKKIEEVLDIELLGQCDNWLQHRETEEKSCIELNPYILKAITRNFRLLYHKQCELTKAVNYLLEKESDK